MAPKTPKSKQPKIEWVICEMCNCYYSSKDFTKHVTTYEGVCELQDCGYCNKGCLIGLCQVKTGLQDDIPSHLQECLIFIHPQTIKLLNLCIGQLAILQHTYAVKIWPDQSLMLPNVGINEKLWKELKLRKNEQVVVHGIQHCTVSASSVNLYINTNRADVLRQNSFSLYLKQVLEGRILTAGNKINSSFYGMPLEILVYKIIGEDLENVNLEDNIHVLLGNSHESDLSESVDVSINSLSQSLFDFSLSDSILTSSPIKDVKEDKQINVKSSSSVRCITENQNIKFFLITGCTKINILKKECDTKFSNIEDESFSDENFTLDKFGGYESQVKSISDMLNRILLHHIESNDSRGQQFKAPRGVLLYGPSGCGKSMLTKTLVKSHKLYSVYINGADIWSKFYGESEAKLRTLFNEAKEKSPSVIILEELDNLCPKRESSQSDIEKRVQTSLLSLIDDIVANEEAIFVLATTNKRDNIDPSLRRPGRLDKEIELGVPTATERGQIIQVLLKSVKHSITIEDITDVASSAHGFVGADIQALLKEGGLNAVKRCKDLSSSSETVMTRNDLMQALNTIQPSAMREVAIEVPNVKWNDIGGQAELKHKLKQAIEWPLKHPEAFLRLGIRPPKGLLMYGPPGCSKTMIAKALANESGINFIAIKGPELFSKWVGESEKAVREVFRKARSAAPAIIFFDEIDALAGERGSSGGGGGGDVSDRVLAQLLTEIDGVEALKDVTIVAATNRPDRIDKALLRPGRLDRIVYVPLPDISTRKEIFQIQFRNMPIADDVDIDKLVEKTKGYSGAEVTAVCHEAALSAMQEDINIQNIHNRHFYSALKLVTTRLTSTLLQFYETYAGISGLHSL